MDVKWPRRVFMGGNLIFHGLDGLTTMKDRAEVTQKPTGANRIELEVRVSHDYRR